MPWQTKPIGELATFHGGGTPTRSEAAYYDGDIPWVTPKDMKRWQIRDSAIRLTAAGVSASPAKLLPAKSVLVVVRSGVLKHSLPVAVAEVPVTVNQDMKALVSRPGIEPRYLARLIKASEGIVLSWVRATTADNFPVNNLKALHIPVPPIEEQRRIANILDRADTLRAKRREAFILLNDLAKSIFLDMFGDPASNPRGWVISTVGDLSQVQGGLQVSAARTRHEQKAPYLRVANVHRGRLDLDEIKTIGLTENELLRTELTKGDLLVVEGHGNPEEIGRVAIWDGSIDGCVHQNHLIRVRCSEPDLLPEFAEAYLNSSGGRRFLLRSGKTTSGLNTISTSNVKQTPIALPPVDRQREFAETLAAVNRVSELNAVSDTKSNNLFAALQDRAFAGLL